MDAGQRALQARVSANPLAGGFTNKHAAPSTSESSVTDASSVKSGYNVERKIEERQTKLEEQAEILERRMKERQQELEEQAEALQRQINAQNSVIYAPRGVQVITPGRVIHY